MKVVQNDEFIEKVFKEYQKTVDSALMVAMSKDKDLQGRLFEAAKQCGITTFKQFYESYLRQFDRLN